MVYEDCEWEYYVNVLSKFKIHDNVVITTQVDKKQLGYIHNIVMDSMKNLLFVVNIISPYGGQTTVTADNLEKI